MKNEEVWNSSPILSKRKKRIFSKKILLPEKQKHIFLVEMPAFSKIYWLDCRHADALYGSTAALADASIWNQG